MKIGLVTDSTCDLSSEIVKNNNIEIVPLTIHFAEEEIYRERFDITNQEFFEKMEKENSLPTTSQPAIGLFVEKYEKLLEEYDKVISIHISGKFSGTVKSAEVAAKQVDGTNINVIDSCSVSLGLGYLVLLASKLINKDRDIDEILDTIKKASNNISIYFTVNDLSYLQKGGRIGKAQAFLGNILSFYPILSIPGEQGEILPFEKVRGKKKIARRMVQLAKDEIESEEYAWLAFVHAGENKYFNILKEDVADYVKNNDKLNSRIECEWISTIVGCHTGPVIYGVIIVKGDFLDI